LMTESTITKLDLGLFFAAADVASCKENPIPNKSL